MSADPRLPDDPLRSPRVVLRRMRADDADDVVAACSDATVQQHLYRMPSPYTHADAEEYLSGPAVQAWEEGRAQWTIADPVGDRYLGAIGVPRTQRDFRTAEIGYLLAPWARGSGLATEAVTTVTEFLYRHGFERTELHISPENIGSQRVALRAGYRRDTVLRGADTNRAGHRVPRMIFSRLPVDPPGPTARTLPDLPGGELTDGVIRLRPPRPADAPARFELANLDDVWRYSVPPRPPERANIENECRYGNATEWLSGQAARMVITEAGTDRFLGEVALHVMMPELGEAMLSYSLSPAARGTGYTTRAVRLVCGWAFESAGFKRLIAGTAPQNLASQKVLQRAGFTREGLERSRLPGVNDSRVDNVLWSLLPDDPSWTS